MILNSVSNSEYKLELPIQLAIVHPVFHILLLKKCMGDPSSIVLYRVLMKDSVTHE